MAMHDTTADFDFLQNFIDSELENYIFALIWIYLLIY